MKKSNKIKINWKYYICKNLKYMFDCFNKQIVYLSKYLSKYLFSFLSIVDSINTLQASGGTIYGKKYNSRARGEYRL
jgi:hypothetical protein